MGKNNKNEDDYFPGDGVNDVYSDKALSLAAFRAVAKGNDDSRFDKPALRWGWGLQWAYLAAPSCSPVLYHGRNLLRQIEKLVQVQ